jgi:hypothetical protein
MLTGAVDLLMFQRILDFDGNVNGIKMKPNDVQVCAVKLDIISMDNGCRRCIVKSLLRWGRRKVKELLTAEYQGFGTSSLRQIENELFSD